MIIVGLIQGMILGGFFFFKVEKIAKKGKKGKDLLPSGLSS